MNLPIQIKFLFVCLFGSTHTSLKNDPLEGCPNATSTPEIVIKI